MPEKPFALTQNAPASPQAEDYDAIHSAVMETSRGNWFLTEFARRNRNADTALVLAAIKRIESAMRNQTAISGLSHAADQAAAYQDPLSKVLAHQLHELRDAIALTKESLPEIAADGRIALRNADFSRIASGIERVAGRMRASAEQAAQAAQALRERAHKEFGIEKNALDRRASELDAQAQDLSTFCAQLDEQIESARMVATLLAEIEAQLDGMIARQKNAPPDNKWMEDLAPPVHARNAPDTPANFDFAEETRPAAALPNPAAREAEDGAPAPTPPKPHEPAAQPPPAMQPRIAEPPVADMPIVPRIKVMQHATVPATPEPLRAPKPGAALPPQSATSDDPTDFLFEPIPQTAEPQPAPAMNGAAMQAKPAAPPIKPTDPLAPIMALSDEEKIALFS